MKNKEREMTDFRKNAIVVAILATEEKIRVNGVPPQKMARNWAMLASLHGRMGDRDQQAFALNRALQLNPDQPWANQMKEELQIY